MSVLSTPVGGMTTVFAGRFDFEDGGTYCGGWEDGKAHGHGVCTGPKSMGEFSGLWQFGYEMSGIYIWPSGNFYMGQWSGGKRHGLGVEKKQRWIYKGEWMQGFKGRYGVRISEQSGARYEGTWANGLQDGYGSETYADGGTYFGQMSQGMRNGYGIRKSVSYGVASRYRSKDVKDSLTSLRSEEGDERVQRERDKRFDENRGGFVLRARSDLTEEVAAGVTSSGTMPGGGFSGASAGAGGGNIMTNAINGLLRRRRNSYSQNQDRRVSLRKTIMSKLKKQKSVGDIDEIHGTHSGSQAANLNTITSSSGRAHKKSSFRSTSSNNSVDSRASNRTAPAGIGLNSPASLAGAGHLHNMSANSANIMDDGEHSFISQDEITDVNCIEVYMGEWKQDKRTGFGIAERSDGLKYEGEWFNNKKNGYGVTTFKDGTKEEGKYKNNVLATDKKKTNKFFLRSNKIRQKIDAAVNAALKAGQIAQQRADIALSRAVNARNKSHAAEWAAKQARADSDYSRIKAREVAPDFNQPGETKKLPELLLDIDRGGPHANGFVGPFQPQISQTSTGGAGLADPVALNSFSPDQFRKLHSPILNPNVQQQQQQQPKPDIYMDQFLRGGGGGLPPGSLLNSGQDPYLSWQQQAALHQPHSSTPPPSMSRISATNVNHPSQQSPQPHPQFYDQNLIISAQHLQQLHSSQKLNNEMLGLGQTLDAQTLAQLQQQQQQQQSYMQQNKHLYPNYSFDEQQLAQNSYYDEGGGRMNLLQQAQSHSFNMDMANSVVGAGSGGPSFDYTGVGGGQFDRNNPRRNTLKRGQRVVDQSNEELNNNVSTLMNMSPAELGLLGISPQQQQQILMNMRAQQYSNNSSGQESGIGSSVYTNSAHGTHDLLVNTNAQMSVRPNLSPNSQINRALVGQEAGGGGMIRPNNQSPSSLLHQQQVQHHQQHQQPSPTANQTTNSLDISQTAAAASSLPRRKSLPSIVKSKSFKEDETAHSSAELNDRNTQDMFIIENGIRKRVCEKTNSALNQNKNETTPAAGLNDTGSDYESNMNKKMPIDFDDDETPQLPRKIVLESITSLDMLSTNTNSKRVSMPSIPAYLSPKFASKVMSREEANRLSSLRREELRQNRELENNRALRLKNMLKNDTISMFFKTTTDCSIQTDDEEYSSWIKV